MTDPVISEYGGVFIYYTCDRDPTSDEPLVYNDYSGLLLLWWNTVSGDTFWCTDNTASAMVWQKNVTDLNISSSLSDLGFVAPASQNYTNVSLSFGSNRTPSSTKNTLVVATVTHTSVLLGGATVNVVVNGTTIATSSLSGVAATEINSLSFIVGPTDTYQLSQSTTGIGSSNTLTLVKEFYM